MFGSSARHASSRAVSFSNNISLRSVCAAVALTLLAAAPSKAADFTGVFRGNAYATFANAKAGPVAASLGRSAFVSCTCTGTNGQTQSNEVASISAGYNGNVLIAA